MCRPDRANCCVVRLRDVTRKDERHELFCFPWTQAKTAAKVKSRLEEKAKLYEELKRRAADEDFQDEGMQLAAGSVWLISAQSQLLPLLANHPSAV
jgi:hypothetical protein